VKTETASRHLEVITPVGTQTGGLSSALDERIDRVKGGGGGLNVNFHFMRRQTDQQDFNVGYRRHGYTGGREVFAGRGDQKAIPQADSTLAHRSLIRI
jgi:hypothetical protein